jgi:hypothetical protein
VEYVEAHLNYWEGFEEVQDDHIEDSAEEEEDVEDAAEEASVILEFFEEASVRFLESLLLIVIEAMLVLVDEHSSGDRGSQADEECNDSKSTVGYDVERANFDELQLEESSKE